MTNHRTSVTITRSTNNTHIPADPRRKITHPPVLWWVTIDGETLRAFDTKREAVAYVKEVWELECP